MVNPLGQWLQVPFCSRSRIPLRGLSGFRVPWGLVVPSQQAPSPYLDKLIFLNMFIQFLGANKKGESCFIKMFGPQK